MGAQPDAVRNTVPVSCRDGWLSGSPGIARCPENGTVPPTLEIESMACGKAGEVNPGAEYSGLT